MGAPSPKNLAEPWGDPTESVTLGELRELASRAAVPAQIADRRSRRDTMDPTAADPTLDDRPVHNMIYQKCTKEQRQ